MDSKEECEAAATSLGLKDTSAQDVTSAQYLYPHGCYYKKSTTTLWWNSDGDKNEKDTNRVSLCGLAGQFGVVQCHLYPSLCNMF
jgi:protein involved in sex pheromone biosynthesis